MTQQRLFPKQPSRGQRLAQQNLEAARAIVQAGEETYGAGLVEWAKRVLAGKPEDAHVRDAR